jgi:hypothetical protein
MLRHYSIAETRRIALAAQGFGRPRPSRAVSAKDLAAVIRRIGLLQIDYVNVLIPAQYQVPFSRLGPYRRTLLDDVVYSARRQFTEQWAHEASIVPMSTWALLRHRMDHHRVRPWGFADVLEKQAAYAAFIVEEIRRRGPLTASDLPDPDFGPRRIPGAWVGTVPRAVMEAHFGRGLLAAAARQTNFARVFDLAERIIPEEHFSRRVTKEEAQRELLLVAARAHGVGTAADLADYFRLPLREARMRLRELVESGALAEARVEGWREMVYVDPEARVPKRIEAKALISPFDPLIWRRDRASRLFGFHYRVEIWVPQAQRKWGYYVLPFLYGERFAARVDLKADRAGGRLWAPAAYLEPGEDAGEIAAALAAELRVMAAWLGLERVEVARKGNLARALGAALKLV